MDLQLEHRVAKAEEEFDAVSKSIRKEVERFELQRYHDFKTAIISYLESVLNNQQQVCSLYCSQIMHKMCADWQHIIYVKIYIIAHYFRTAFTDTGLLNGFLSVFY